MRGKKTNRNYGERKMKIKFQKIRSVVKNQKCKVQQVKTMLLRKK